MTIRTILLVSTLMFTMLVSLAVIVAIVVIVAILFGQSFGRARSLALALHCNLFTASESTPFHQRYRFCTGLDTRVSFDDNMIRWFTTSSLSPSLSEL